MNLAASSDLSSREITSHSSRIVPQGSAVLASLVDITVGGGGVKEEERSGRGEKMSVAVGRVIPGSMAAVH